jgi:protein TonB
MQFFLVLHLNKKQRIMEINKILSADILDILFDGRNKEYGAYELRKSYNKRITYALVATFAAVLLLFVGSLLINSAKKKAG